MPDDVVLRTIEIESWDDVLKFCQTISYRSYVFRGMHNPEWSIESSLDRMVRISNKITNKKACERTIVEKFKSRYEIYTNHINPETDFDIIAYIQHYGGPTRLIDFTKEFYIAFFFAIINNPGDSAIIWCLNRNKIDFKDSIDSFNKDLITPAENNLYLLEVNKLNKRISAQSGIFVTYTGTNLEKEYVKFEELLNVTKFENGFPSKQSSSPFDLNLIDDQVVKVIIKNNRWGIYETFDDYLEQLTRINLNYERLFLDIEGLTKSLSQYTYIYQRDSKSLFGSLANLFDREHLNNYVFFSMSNSKIENGNNYYCTVNILLIDNKKDYNDLIAKISELDIATQWTEIVAQLKTYNGHIYSVSMNYTKSNKEKEISHLIYRLINQIYLNNNAPNIYIFFSKADKRNKIFHELVEKCIYLKSSPKTKVISGYRKSKALPILEITKKVGTILFRKNFRKDFKDFYTIKKMIKIDDFIK